MLNARHFLGRPNIRKKMADDGSAYYIVVTVKEILRNKKSYDATYLFQIRTEI